MINILSHYKWIFAVIVIMVVLIRIPALSSRTIHIDEGMGIRASELVISGDYNYSPYNGHGPTLFILGAIARKLLGTNIIFFRIITSLFSLASIFTLWFFLKKELGKEGLFFLLLGLGFSSSFLFYGAYFIHEMLFIFLTVLAFVFALKFKKTNNGLWLFGFVIFCVLMYMTKETALITYFAWFLAGFLVMLWQKNFTVLKKLISLKNLLFILLGIISSAILYLLLFGTGVDLFISPFLWLWHRGTKMFINPPYYFLNLLFLHETFLLFSGGISAIYLSFQKQWNPLKLFLFLWFVFILLAYSAIPYKTPWLIPNMVLPLAIFSMLSLADIWKKESKPLMASALIILFLASFSSLVADNFLHPDRAEASDFAFLQSGKSFRKFMLILDGISKISPQQPMPVQIVAKGDELLHVITEKYNRSYPPFVQNIPVYINYWSSHAQLQEITGGNYKILKFTYFNPGPEIDLFVRKDLFYAYSKSAEFIAPKAISSDGTMWYE